MTPIIMIFADNDNLIVFSIARTKIRTQNYHIKNLILS